MSLIRVQQASIAFGPTPVLDNVSLTIEPGARIALVGRNGEGKSTLLKILAQQQTVDQGDLAYQSGIKIAYLPQSVPTDLNGTVYETVASGLAEVGTLLGDYHQCSIKLAQQDNSSPADLDAVSKQLARLQDAIDAVDGWTYAQKIEHTLSTMQLDPSLRIEGLSGGMKRRVILAKSLVSEPDVLLLDEPTNHLDMGAVAWLETHLQSLSCAIVFVTHDRAFLSSLAKHIIEIDRGKITEWPGNFEAYKVNKQKLLEVEEQQNALFDKKLAQEEVWIRQGIKARRTRNEGRVRALKKLREQHAQRRKQRGTVKMAVNQGELSGKMVFEAENVHFKYNNQSIINQLTTTVLRDDRVGIIGPNGCGKTTLVKLLVGELTPTSGSIHIGTKLQVAYYDQLRSQLKVDLSAADNVSGGRDMVETNGQTRHIMSYMQDFLFEPSRARAPITALSGGEIGRLMLAKLFLLPSNVIVLDEPSNDLDIETLELLESLLGEYKGTVVLISHDRQLLDNVVTRSLIYQGHGNFIDGIGGFEDFERERVQSSTLKPIFDLNDPIKSSSSTQSKTLAEESKTTPSTDKKAKSTLTYAERLELDAMPEQISNMESNLQTLHNAMNASNFYDSKVKADKTIQESQKLQESLDALYTRWDELETKHNGGA